MATLTTVRLTKGDSPTWGFRLQGGKDFGTPLVIQKVNGGSPAERAGLIAGDAVIKINHVDVFNLLHKEAQDVIVRAGPSFEMVIQRGGSTWRPSVVSTGIQQKPSPSINNVSPVTRTSLAHKGENIAAIGTGHNLSAKPFAPQVNGAVNGSPKLVNKQYNSPLKLYSEDAIAETISAQSEVLSTGALGVNFKKNEKDYDATNSAVYRMLKEAESDSSTHLDDTEPDSGIVTSPNRGIAGLKHVEAPQTKPAPSNPQLPPGQNICAECERLIVGVFVRIKDKNLHVECFKCSTCGSSLKNVGYYNINNKLYCDIHAKSAAIAINNPNAVPISVPSGGKTPTSAISAALSSHSPLSPKLPTYAPSYPPNVEESAAVDVTPLTNLNSAPSYEPNIKPTSNNSSLYNSPAPLSFSNFVNKSSNIGGPKPFSSVSGPLSPGGTLPRAPLSPQGNYNKAPLSPSAPSYGSYSPASTGRCTNITWPPPHEESDIPTACPLFYPPTSKVEADLEKKLAAKRQQKIESEYSAEESEDINMEETMSFYSEELSFSGRRSANECVEILSETLDTQKLVESVIKSSAPILNGNPPQTNGHSCPITLPTKEVESCDLKRPTQYNPNTIECQLPSKVVNTVPQKWESSLTQALRTTAPDPDTFTRIPSRTAASPLVSALAIAPAQPFNVLAPLTSNPVPLPEMTEPYFPPEHPIVPKQQEEKKVEKPPIPKPYSPFVKALEIAPDRPFTPAGGPAAPIPTFKKKKDPLDSLLDELPKPAERTDMRSALTTAPERSYTPLSSEYLGVSVEAHKDQKVDRSQLIRPLKPEELPESFKMNKSEPKPPSYYAPAVIEERIKSETQVSEDKEMTISEKEIIQPAQQVITTSTVQEQSQPAMNFAPIFQGFSCSFKNKSDHSQFSIEVCTTPPVPTPPPKPQTPISYVATVEERPACMTREKVIQEKIHQTTEENYSREVKQQQQQVHKQAEEVVQVKPVPVTAMLRKPETLPSYQLDLQATAEADLILMERKKRAEERIEQQKREKEAATNVQIEQQKREEKANVQQTAEYTVYQKPIITIEPGDSRKCSMDDKPASGTFSPRPRSITPSMINKAPPILPYYQDNLVPHYHNALETNLFDPAHPEISRSPSPNLIKETRSRSPSPFRGQLERAKSPAEGPPPNPLRSDRPLPTPQDSRLQQAKESLKSYLPDYKSQRDVVEQQKGMSFGRNSLDGVNQNVAYPVGEFAVQTGVVQQRVANSQKHESRVSEAARVDISQTVHQEHLEASNRMQSCSTETSADGLVQVQRKKTVTEEFEHNHKESNTEISTKRSFCNVNVPVIDSPNVQSFHVTNPHHVPLPFKAKEALTYEEVKPQPPVRRVFPPGALAPIKHVTAPSACQRPSENVTKPNVPKPDVGAGAGRQAGGITAAPKRGRGLLNTAALPGSRVPLCGHCHEHARELHRTNLSETTAYLEQVEQLPLPPPPVPVYSQINISIPQQNFHLDSIGSSPKSDYSTHSSASTEKAKDKIISEINKGLIPKLKRVSMSETQSPRLNFIVSNVNTVVENNVKRVKSELVVPINNDHKIVSEDTLPDHLTFANKAESVFKRFSGETNLRGNDEAPICWKCNSEVPRGPFITALGNIWCPQHFVCATPSCKRPLQDLGFVEERGQLYCEYCFEQYLAPPCSKCNGKIKGDCLKAIGKSFHPECFNCVYCGKLFGNNPFFLEDGNPYCDADWNELFTTKCFACGFPVEAGDRWVEALNNNYHSQCFNCTMCKKNLEGQSFFAKGGRPFCKNHAR